MIWIRSSSLLELMHSPPCCEVWERGCTTGVSGERTDPDRSLRWRRVAGGLIKTVMEAAKGASYRLLCSAASYGQFLLLEYCFCAQPSISCRFMHGEPGQCSSVDAPSLWGVQYLPRIACHLKAPCSSSFPPLHKWLNGLGRGCYNAWLGK